MKANKIIYWVATAIMCGIFAFSAFMYITKYDMISGFFPVLGFPAWLVAPLAAFKILGIIAVLYRKVSVLKEWAYAGFFFDALLATGAHYDHGDGIVGLSLLALIATVVSRVFDNLAFDKA